MPLGTLTGRVHPVSLVNSGPSNGWPSLALTGLWHRKKYAELVYHFFGWFGGSLGSASRAEFPVSLSNHIDFIP